MTYSLPNAASDLVVAVSRGTHQCITISTAACLPIPRHLMPAPEPSLKSYREGSLQGAEVYVVPDLTISYRLMMKNYAGFLSIPRVLPGYYAHTNDFLEQRRIKEQIIPNTIIVDSPVYVVFTSKYREYGHFLIETLPKMLVARHLIDGGARFPVVVPLNPPAWVEQYISIIFREEELIRINELHDEAIIAVAIVPTLLGDGSLFHPFFGELIGQHLINNRAESAGGRRIFISRENFLLHKRQADFRYWENEAEIKTLLLNAGFEVVEPELLLVRQQHHVFSTASHIAGESSSALHNILFSSRGARVLGSCPLSWCRTDAVEQG